MTGIIDNYLATINTEKNEMTLLGWQDQPVGIAYLRDIDPKRFLAFLGVLREFVVESETEGCDLEFIL